MSMNTESILNGCSKKSSQVKKTEQNTVDFLISNYITNQQ